MDAVIYTHGKAKGNPGPAAVGVYVTDGSGQALGETKETIGNGTDIYASYHAVLRGLQAAQELFDNETRDKKFEIRLDNEVVKEQLNNEQPVNEPGLVPLFIEIHNLRVVNFPHLTLTNVSPAENREANHLVSEALEST